MSKTIHITSHILGPDVAHVAAPASKGLGGRCQGAEGVSLPLWDEGRQGWAWALLQQLWSKKLCDDPVAQRHSVSWYCLTQRPGPGRITGLEAAGGPILSQNHRVQRTGGAQHSSVRAAGAEGTRLCRRRCLSRAGPW